MIDWWREGFGRRGGEGGNPPADLRGTSGGDPLSAAAPSYRPVVEIAVGNRGYGKTWQIRRRAAELLQAGAAGVYAHDPWGAYPEEGLEIGAKGDGWAILPTPDEWNGEPVCSFRRCEPEAVADFVRRRPAPAVLVVDELDLICRANRWNSEAARDIVHYGRHLKLSILGSARRFSNVHQDILSLADRIYLHRLTWDRDLDRVEENWGAGVRDMVSQLPKPPDARRHFLVIPDDVEGATATAADPDGDVVDEEGPEAIEVGIP